MGKDDYADMDETTYILDGSRAKAPKSERPYLSFIAGAGAVSHREALAPGALLAHLSAAASTRARLRRRDARAARQVCW